MREHGTRARYVHGPGPGSGPGCRCDLCRAANTQAARDQLKRAAPPYVAATRARDHLAALAAQGVGLKTVARVSGVSNGALTKLVYGDRQRGTPPSRRIRPATEKAILGVTAAHATGGQRTHTADDYRALLDLLTGRGWTATAIANAIGVTPPNLRRRAGARTVTAAKMAATRKLLDLTPVTRRDRWGNQAEPAWTPEQDRRDKARRATAGEERAAYRAAGRAGDDLPTIDLAQLAAQQWRQHAACRLLPDDQTHIFWPGKGDTATLAAARAVCLTCPVAQDCLDHALANNEQGIWGGTTAKQRRHMAAGRTPAVAPAPPPPPPARHCRHCGNPIAPHAAKFCSRTCAMRHRWAVA